MNGRLTITEVADRVGVTARTIRRWETARKVRKANASILEHLANSTR